INVANIPSTSGWTQQSGGIVGDGSGNVVIDTPYNLYLGSTSIKLNGYLSTDRAWGATINGTHGAKTLHVYSSFVFIQESTNVTVEFLNMHGQTPQIFDRIYMINKGTGNIAFGNSYDFVYSNSPTLKP